MAASDLMFYDAVVTVSFDYVQIPNLIVDSSIEFSCSVTNMHFIVLNLSSGMLHLLHLGSWMNDMW